MQPDGQSVELADICFPVFIRCHVVKRRVYQVG